MNEIKFNALVKKIRETLQYVAEKFAPAAVFTLSLVVDAIVLTRDRQPACGNTRCTRPNQGCYSSSMA